MWGTSSKDFSYANSGKTLSQGKWRKERVAVTGRKQMLKVKGADAKSAMIFKSETFSPHNLSANH